MTDEQRYKIKILRYQGFGYKKIANEVGLSRDSVTLAREKLKFHKCH